MQELEPYGAASSHNIGWSRSRKVMRLRQLQLRSYVKQKKTSRHPIESGSGYGSTTLHKILDKIAW
jgi:hypothetical protein